MSIVDDKPIFENKETYTIYAADIATLGEEKAIEKKCKAIMDVYKDCNNGVWDVQRNLDKEPTRYPNGNISVEFVFKKYSLDNEKHARYV